MHAIGGEVRGTVEEQQSKKANIPPRRAVKKDEG